MDEIAGNTSDRQKAIELEMDYYSWLTDEEEELFDHSDFENVKDWVESFYGVSIDFWMDTKQILKLIEQSSPKVHRKLATPPTRQMPILRQIKRYVRIESGKTIIMMRLSRGLLSEELSVHRNADCPFLKSCAAFTIKVNKFPFSCIVCPQANNLKKD